MSKSFDALHDEVSRSWDDETREFYERAGSFFAYQAREQMRIGQEIASQRKKHNLTQEQLEALSGVGQAEISKIERGIANPTRDTLIRIAGAMRLKISFVPDESVDLDAAPVARAR